jgi:hypothetical protein
MCVCVCVCVCGDLYLHGDEGQLDEHDWSVELEEPIYNVEIWK